MQETRGRLSHKRAARRDELQERGTGRNPGITSAYQRRIRECHGGRRKCRQRCPSLNRVQICHDSRIVRLNKMRECEASILQTEMSWRSSQSSFPAPAGSTRRTLRRAPRMKPCERGWSSSSILSGRGQSQRPVRSCACAPWAAARCCSEFRSSQQIVENFRRLTHYLARLISNAPNRAHPGAVRRLEQGVSITQVARRAGSGITHTRIARDADSA